MEGDRTNESHNLRRLTPEILVRKVTTRDEHLASFTRHRSPEQRLLAATQTPTCTRLVTPDTLVTSRWSPHNHHVHSTKNKMSEIVGRHATAKSARPVTTDTPVTYVEHGEYDELSIGLHSSLVERNSVVLIPNLLSADECAMLVADVERAHASSVTETGTEDQPDTGTERYMVEELSESVKSLFQVILRQRLLPFVDNHLKSVEENIWAISGVERPLEKIEEAKTTGAAAAAAAAAVAASTSSIASCTLARQNFVFSSQEPAINRYATGGAFEPHRDTLALTLNVLLSENFEGGGTVFWNEIPAVAASKISKITLLPKAGVGVVFNGTVLHAGREVTAGLRHLLVASFSVDATKNTR